MLPSWIFDWLTAKKAPPLGPTHYHPLQYAFFPIKQNDGPEEESKITANFLESTSHPLTMNETFETVDDNKNIVSKKRTLEESSSQDTNGNDSLGASIEEAEKKDDNSNTASDRPSRRVKYDPLQVIMAIMALCPLVH